MPDDIALWLRTARALDLKMYYEEEWFGERYYYYAEGEREHQPIADYSADLGACAEVLAAIEARGWRWQCYLLDDDVVALIDHYPATRRRGGVIQATAPTLPEAICEAFCRAVEASKA